MNLCAPSFATNFTSSADGDPTSCQGKKRRRRNDGKNKWQVQILLRHVVHSVCMSCSHQFSLGRAV